MKKKILSFLTAVLMTVTFGCSDKDNESTKSAETIVFSSSGGTYPKGMIYNFGIDSPTMFLDFETMEKAPLCAVPNCTHTVSSCLGMMVGKNPVIYNDYVYYFVSDFGYDEVPEGHQFYMKSTLYRAKLDSSETEKVVEFSDGIPDEWNSNILLIGNTIWFLIDDVNPPPENIYDDSWMSSSDTPGAHFMCSINLDTGEYNNYGSVSDDYLESPNWTNCNGAVIKGVYDGKIQIGIEYGAGRDFHEFDYATSDPDEFFINKNVEFDIETKEAVTTERYYPVIADENVYIGYDSGVADKVDLYIIYNGREFTVKDGQFNAFLLDDKLFMLERDMWYDLSDFSEHLVPDKLKEHDFIRAAYFEGDYIFINAKSQAIKLTEEELLALE